MSETEKALRELHQRRSEELGWQHPAVCLAEAAFLYDSTDACKQRAMMAAHTVLQDAVR